MAPTGYSFVAGSISGLVTSSIHSFGPDILACRFLTPVVRLPHCSFIVSHAPAKGWSSAFILSIGFLVVSELTISAPHNDFQALSPIGIAIPSPIIPSMTPIIFPKVPLLPPNN